MDTPPSLSKSVVPLLNVHLRVLISFNQKAVAQSDQGERHKLIIFVFWWVYGFVKKLCLKNWVGGRIIAMPCICSLLLHSHCYQYQTFNLAASTSSLKSSSQVCDVEKIFQIDFFSQLLGMMATMYETAWIGSCCCFEMMLQNKLRWATLMSDTLPPCMDCSIGRVFSLREVSL